MYEVKTVYCQTFTNFVATAKEAGAKVKKVKGHSSAIVTMKNGSDTIGTWNEATKQGYITFYEEGCAECGRSKIGQEGDKCKMCANGWHKVEYNWPEGLDSTLVAYSKLETCEDPEMMLRVFIEVDDTGTLECVASRTEPACGSTIVDWLVEEGCLPTEDEELNGGDCEEDDDDTDWNE